MNSILHVCDLIIKSYFMGSQSNIPNEINILFIKKITAQNIIDNCMSLIHFFFILRN